MQNDLVEMRSIRDAFCGVDESSGAFVRNLRRVRQQGLRQRFQPGLPGYLRLGAAFGFVWEIQVLEPPLVVACPNLLFQLATQSALVPNAAQNHHAALFELSQIAQSLVQLPQLRVVQASCDLLAIARDKGHGSAVFEQTHGRTNLCPRRPNFFGYLLNYVFHLFVFSFIYS